jgi:hypothetical protein
MAMVYRDNSGWRGQSAINGKRKTKEGFSTKRDVMAWTVSEGCLIRESAFAFSRVSCCSSHLVVPNLEKNSLTVLQSGYCALNISDSLGLLG